MARYGVVGSGPRIVVLFLLVTVLLLAGFIWFDFLGILNAREVLAPVYGLIGIRKQTKVENQESGSLLDQQRLLKLEEALTLREQELDARETALAERETTVEQMAEALAEKERDLEDREKTFNDRKKQDEIRSANLRVISGNLVGMPPEKAVERLVAMDDQDIIDILRTTDAVAAEADEFSMVSYWLSLMPPAKAADINRKMLRKPGT